MPTILCLHGPNLDRLGSREPATYGSTTLRELEGQVETWGTALDFDVLFRQSNDEGELIDAIGGAGDLAGVIFNPGALTHTSHALRDAIASIEAPVVEVHLSNVRARDRWRRRSVIAPVASCSIFGRGLEGYRGALRHLANRRGHEVRTLRYGPHQDQVVDAWAAPATDLGVILLHGGFWLDSWGRDVTESWAADLAAGGIPVANIEYRRLGSGGGARATGADVVDATALALSVLGVESAVVVGHSAGGHLAVWAAIAHPREEIVGTVGVSGIYDLAAAAADGLGGGAAARFDPAGVTSPALLAAPAGRVALLHGSDDQVVPARQSADYASLRQGNGEVSYRIVDGAGHFDVLSPESAVWSEVRRVIETVRGRSG